MVKSSFEKEISNVNISWSLNYAGLGIGYFFPIVTKRKMTIETGLMAGGDFLVDSKQTIGNNVYKSNETPIFSISNFKLSGMFNFVFMLSDEILFISGVRYSKSVSQIENNDTNVGQTTKLSSIFPCIGFQYKL